MKKKPQILLIHGGMTFKSRRNYLRYLKTHKITLAPKMRWTDQYLDKKLGKVFEIIKPRMPQAQNAKYEDWKIWLERYSLF